MEITAPTSVGRQDTKGDLGATLRTLRQALLKQWPLIVACLLVAVGGSLLYSQTARRVYQASSMLEINPHVAQPLGDKADDVFTLGASLFWDPREYYETQYKIIASDRVLSAVVRDLSLTHDADFMASVRGAKNEEGATDLLRKRLTVEPVRSSRLVNVKVEDTDPRRAKKVCDAIGDAYIDQNLQAAISVTADAATWLNGQVDSVRKELERDENALHEFKQRNDLPSTSINEASNMLRVEMQELDTALTHTRTRKQELLARQAELTKLSPDNPDDLPASELLGSEFLRDLRRSYQTARQQYVSLLASGKGENHPEVKSAAEKVAVAKAALLAEVRNIQGAVERDLGEVSRQEQGEGTLFEATRKRAVDLNMKEIEFHRLDRTRSENEKLYSILLERMKEADLSRMMKANNIRVVDVAVEPVVPIRPRLLLNLGLGTAFGLLLGVGLALLREQLDSSVKTPDDVEQKLGVTFLGLLPEIGEEEESESGTKRRRQGRRKRRQEAPANTDGSPLAFVVHTRPLSGIAEAARSIRTNLLFMNPDRPYRRLLISSAGPSEGKTTVACSIAIALAQGGQRVCIVDCDLRRPRLHRVFGRVGEAGVTNVLVGDATVSEVAKPTRVDNLWSIPAGPAPPNPADVLHSERFRKFIDELSERFDRVVIDSPPVAAVTDAAILSTLVDGTVFVVRAFQTSKQLATQGLRTFRDVDAPLVGVVLNAVNLNQHEYNYYYHYYYYKHGGYRSDPTDDAQESSAQAPN